MNINLSSGLLMIPTLCTGLMVLTWTNLGGPIQGPPGDDGADGADGLNGAPGRDGTNGKGWTGTTIDTTNDEYKITFDSDDGLEFTTANLKGEKGDPGDDFNGSFPIATENSLGVVQVGDGLDIDTAGNLSVDLETVEL